jgi:uncharacterized protein YydD (DUF2326 family)
MIREVWSHTRPEFKRLRFKPGLNIVLVRRKETSTQGAKRNAAGKSSLIDIFHFIFGGNREPTSPLSASELATDAFKLTFDLLGKPITISRLIEDSSRIEIEGDFHNWPVQPDIDEKTSLVTMTIENWCDLLGRAMFGLPAVSILGTGEFLSFRSCFPYFARRQRSDGYFNWRRHFAQQKPVTWQVSLSFLLGLDREGPLELHRVKEDEKQRLQLEKFFRSELAQIAIPSTAKLKSAARKLKRQLDKLNGQLDDFKIIDFYDDLVDEANTLQQSIDELANANVLDGELVKDLVASMETESPPAVPDIEQLYKEAGVVLPGISLKRYDEVQNFHTAVVSNRRVHLQAELNDARERVATRRKQIAKMSERRNSIMAILNSGGALSHYRRLDHQRGELQSQYETVSRQLELSEKISLMKSDLKVRRAEAERKIRQDLVERREIVEDAASTFEQISQQLYDAPSLLEIRANKNGLDFHVDSPEIASEGISRVQVFTFDLMLATVCAKRGFWPGFLIHDSHIFDGVDGRQVASALRIAGERTMQLGGHYIVTMNSDDLDKAERESSLSFAEYIVQPELDDSPSGCLFGFRFATEDEDSEPPAGASQDTLL